MDINQTLLCLCIIMCSDDVVGVLILCTIIGDTHRAVVQCVRMYSIEKHLSVDDISSSHLLCRHELVWYTGNMICRRTDVGRGGLL